MKTYFRNNFRHARRVSSQKRGALRVFAALALVASLGTAYVSGVGPAVGMFLFANSIALAVAPLEFGPAFGLVAAPTLNYLTGFQGVGNGATATLNVQTNRRYHSIHLWTTIAGSLADPTTVISALELSVNGQVIRNWTPKQYIDHAKTFRITPGTGEIPIFFSEPWKKDRASREATSWDLFNQGSFVIRATFLSPGGGAVGCTVSSVFDLERNLRKGATGMVPFLSIMKMTNLNVNSPSGAGDVTTIPVNYPIQRLILDVSANEISSAEVTADGSDKAFQATKAENQNILNAAGLTGTFNEFPIVFDASGRLSSNLRVQALDLRITCTGANTTTIGLVQQVPGYL